LGKCILSGYSILAAHSFVSNGSCLSFRICVTSITFEHVASLSRCFYLSNNFSIRATNADATLAIVFAALFYWWVGYSDQDDFFRDAGLKKEGEALADFDWQD
jgi:hypothetical protein